MLLQNKSFLSCNGLRHLSGAPALSGVLARSLLGGKIASQPNRYIGHGTSFYKGDGTPSGYSPMYAWYPNRKSGGMGSRYQVVGYGNATGPIYAGRRMPVNITAQGTLSAHGALILLQDMIGDILDAAGTLTAIGKLLVDADARNKIVGVATVVADLIGWLDGDTAGKIIGEGDVVAALGAIGGMVADIIGAATVEAEPFAIGTLNASILSYSTLSPENMAVAVWTALAADFNENGTMGKAMNSASSAGDPWSSIMSSYTDDATFGAFVKKLLTTNGFFGLR
jgi:hypothetical protein